jgi:hypothetical protein
MLLYYVEFNDTTNIFSIDRVDPKKGYVEGNVVACTVEINSKKSNLTIDEIHNLSNQLKKFLQPDVVVEKVVLIEEKHENLSWEKEPVLSKDLPKKKIRRRPKKSTLDSEIISDDHFFEELN